MNKTEDIFELLILGPPVLLFFLSILLYFLRNTRFGIYFWRKAHEFSSKVKEQRKEKARWQETVFLILALISILTIIWIPKSISPVFSYGLFFSSGVIVALLIFAFRKRLFSGSRDLSAMGVFFVPISVVPIVAATLLIGDYTFSASQPFVVEASIIRTFKRNISSGRNSSHREQVYTYHAELDGIINNDRVPLCCVIDLKSKEELGIFKLNKINLRLKRGLLGTYYLEDYWP